MSVPLLVFLALYLIGLWYLKRHRKHFLVFLWGSLLLTALIISVVSLNHWEIPLGEFQALNTQHIAQYFGINLTIMGRTTMLVSTPQGWVGLRIGVECITHFEAAIFVSLVLFYPFATWRKKLTFIVMGLLALYFLNLIRIMIIVGLVAQYDLAIYVLAHGVIARAVFIIGLVAIYAPVFTRSSLRTILNNLTQTQHVPHDA